MLDLKPFGDLRKYLDLVPVAFVAFFGTCGSVGSGMAAAGQNLWLVWAVAIFSGFTVMAGAVLIAAEKSGIRMPIPNGLRKIITTTDVIESPVRAAPDGTKHLD